MRNTPSRHSWPPPSSGPTARRITISREDHDILQLFGRADRFLPHGWCTLPPLQTCDKGNACLTCSVFVTDQTHQQTLERQLDRDRTADRPDHHRIPAAPRPRRCPTTTSGSPSAGPSSRPWPDCWKPCSPAPGRAVQGAGCGTAPGGPVPLAPGPHPPPGEHAMTDTRDHRVAVLAVRCQGKIGSQDQSRRPGHPGPDQTRRARSPSRPSSAKPESPMLFSTTIPSYATASSDYAPNPALPRPRPRPRTAPTPSY